MKNYIVRFVCKMSQSSWFGFINKVVEIWSVEIEGEKPHFYGTKTQCISEAGFYSDMYGVDYKVCDV